MNWLIFLAIGGAGGWVAEMILNRNDSMLWNIIYGCLGALIFGGIVGKFLPFGGYIGQFVAALVGALALCFIIGLIFKKK